MATNVDKPKSTELNLNPSASEKASNATDLNLGTLTMADVTKSKDQKPSTELNLQPLPPEIVNQPTKPKDAKPSTELNLKPLPPEILNQPTKQHEPIIFQTAVGDKIPDALNNIMMMSKEVHNDTINIDNSDPKKPKTYLPLIQSSVIEDPKTKDRTIVYHIKKFGKAMKPSDAGTGDDTSTDGTSNGLDQGAAPGTQQQSQEDLTKLPDILEYDYIYTGKNVDVIQFDMNVKLNFNTLTKIQVVHPNSNRTNQSVTPENKAATQDDPNENAGDASEVTTSTVRGNKVVDAPENGPIGPTVVDPMRIGSGSLSPETLFAARKNLSDDLSRMLTNQTSVLKIVGNPLLLAGYTLPANTLGDSTNEPTSESISQAQQKHTDETGGQTGMTPVVKVNVRVPKPSYMQGQQLSNEDNFYSSPFWMTLNNFRINKITSKFTRGEFVQFLDLLSLAEQSNTDYRSNDPNKPAKQGSGTSSSPSDYGPNVTTNGSGVKPGYQKDFMDKNWNAANKAAGELGTDPKVLLAQAAGETGWGKKTVKGQDGTDSNNLFNIKADKKWHGPTVTKRALEYDKSGNPYYSNQKFRAYGSPEESFADYAHFIKSNPIYHEVVQNPTKDASQYYSALKKAHYATSPSYVPYLMGIYNSGAIKKYNP